ncbi:MAG TPA: YidB family protein [Burkholderiaceae bacterium]
MGLLDSIVGQVSQALAGAPGQAHPGLVDVVGSLLDGSQGGGLAGLVRQFEQQGLGHLVQSWIGSGANLAITPDQVQAVLGEPHLQAVAQRLGLSTQDVANQLAGLLPHAVDAATPGGTLAQGSVLGEALNAFRSLGH